MSKLPDGILKTTSDIQAALRIARGIGMVDPADGGKAKAANNNAKLEQRNKALFQKFLDLRQSGIKKGISVKKSRAIAINALADTEPLSIQQIRRIVRSHEDLAVVVGI